jgi:hypothetical protein
MAVGSKIVEAGVLTDWPDTSLPEAGLTENRGSKTRKNKHKKGYAAYVVIHQTSKSPPHPKPHWLQWSDNDA